MSKKSDGIIEQVKKPQKTTRKDIEFYPSGITLLDLCLGGGFGKGFISNVCGWEATGKTMVACNTLGENVNTIKDFKHKFDNAESGFTLDTKEMFNFKMDMITPSSEKVVQFMYNVETTIEKLRGKKTDIIYVLDSLDGLSDDRESKKHKTDMEKVKKSLEEDKESEIKGDYGGKAKGMSEFFRLNNKGIYESGMHLMITSQLRDKVGIVYGKKEDRTGGKALNFYAAQIVWLYLKQKITESKTIDGVKYERNTVNLVKAVVEKNKLGKSYRHCFLFIDNDYGIDNIKSNIYFLFDLITPTGDLRKPAKIKEEEVNGKEEKGRFLIWEDKKFSSVDDMIIFIEKNNLEKELEKKVIALWNKIENAFLNNRKKKY